MAVQTPLPDKHYSPTCVPQHIDDPLGECFQHTTEVIRRQIRRRTKKLTTTLNGTQWEPPIYTTEANVYAYHLKCPGEDCGEDMQALFFLPCNNQANEGIVCCSKCCEDFRRLANKFQVGVGSTWEKIDHKDYCKFAPASWQSSLTCSNNLLEMNESARATRVANNVNTQRKTTSKPKPKCKPKPKRKNDIIVLVDDECEAVVIPDATAVEAPVANCSTGKRACEGADRPSSRKRRALIDRLDKLSQRVQTIQQEIQDITKELMHDDE